jgi:hypothetical protein
LPDGNTRWGEVGEQRNGLELGQKIGELEANSASILLSPAFGSAMSKTSYRLGITAY